jgi:hypothetical protein
MGLETPSQIREVQATGNTWGARILRSSRRIKAVSKTSSLVLELMALETPTQIREVQTTSAPQNCHAWGARIPRPSNGVMDLSVAYLAHDLLSGFYRPEVLR